MFRKSLLTLLFLLPCICHAWKYKDGLRAYLEPTLDKNYNVLFSNISPVIFNKENNVFFSFDFMYFRVVKDENIWRFSSSTFSTNALWFLIAREIELPDYRDSVPFAFIGGIIPNFFSIITNPIIGYQIAKPLGFAAGYNFDFTIPMRGNDEDNKNKKIFYFAPKVQLELTIIPKGHGDDSILLAPTLSYQVFDYFSTKRGLHWKVALIWQMNLNR